MDEPILAKVPLQPQPLVNFWKVAAISALLAFSLFVVIDILLYLHLANISAEPINLSFLADLTTFSSLLQTKHQFVTLATAMKSLHTQLNYQHAIPLASASLTGIFQKYHNDMLFIIEVAQAGGGSGMFAVYVHGEFGINEGIHQSINQYYALEIDSARKATLIGLNYNDNLKMDGITDNLLQCKTYELQIDLSSFTLLGVIKLQLGDNTSEVSVIDSKASCFSGSTALFASRLKDIIGIDYTRTQPILLQGMEVYHLK